MCKNKDLINKQIDNEFILQNGLIEGNITDIKLLSVKKIGTINNCSSKLNNLKDVLKYTSLECKYEYLENNTKKTKNIEFIKLNNNSDLIDVICYWEHFLNYGGCFNYLTEQYNC